MHDRSALGPADVTDPELASKVAALWEVPHVDLLSSATLPVAYDVPSITTAARTWVVGTASCATGQQARSRGSARPSSTARTCALRCPTDCRCRAVWVSTSSTRAHAASGSRPWTRSPVRRVRRRGSPARTALRQSRRRRAGGDRSPPLAHRHDGPGTPGPRSRPPPAGRRPVAPPRGRSDLRPGAARAPACGRPPGRGDRGGVRRAADCRQPRGLHQVDDVAALDQVLVDAYHAGLADEGLDCDLRLVRRSHAVSMVLFGSLPMVVMDELDEIGEIGEIGEVDDERLHAVCAARAALASYSLELLDATVP